MFDASEKDHVEHNVVVVNFIKESFLRFNLPPLHVMKKRLIPDVVQVKMQEEKTMFLSKRHV